MYGDFDQLQFNRELNLISEDALRKLDTLLVSPEFDQFYKNKISIHPTNLNPVFDQFHTLVVNQQDQEENQDDQAESDKNDGIIENNDIGSA